eukprot:2851641-Rhodomonas_salina.1
MLRWDWRPRAPDPLRAAQPRTLRLLPRSTCVEKRASIRPRRMMAQTRPGLGKAMGWRGKSWWSPSCTRTPKCSCGRCTPKCFCGRCTRERQGQ